MTVPFCEACDRTGLVEDWTTSPPTSHDCPCRAGVLAQRVAARWVADVPMRYRGAALDAEPIASFPLPVLAPLRGYVAELDRHQADGVGLWLGGPLGTGKTTAAWMLVLEARRREHSAALHSLDDLLLALRSTYGDHSAEREHDLIRSLQQLDVLVIDDVAAVKATDAALRALHLIVNRRYEHARPTSITTDLSESELRSFIWPRTVDRLIETTELVTFAGASHRHRPSSVPVEGKW